MRLHVVDFIEEGAGPEALGKTVDIDPRPIYTWLAKFDNGGDAALKTKTNSGRPTKLNGAHLSRLASMIREKNPLQLMFSVALGTFDMVGEVTLREFGVRLLRRLVLTPERPLYRSIDQGSALVERWRSEDFPAIQREARACNARYMVGDEARIGPDNRRGNMWGMQRQTPIVPRTGVRCSAHMLSAISAQRDLRFIVHDGTATAARVCEFLNRLGIGMARSIFVVVDGHRIHRAKTVEHLGGKPKLAITSMPECQRFTYVRVRNSGRFMNCGLVLAGGRECQELQVL